MIILSSVILLFSYLFQEIISNYIGYTYSSLSWFSTIYILIALLGLRQYFSNELKYLLVVVIVGFLMGISYTDAVFLNISLFIVVYFFTRFFHFYFPYNYLTVNISTLLGIFIYHIISFFFLVVAGYDVYTFKMLLSILLHSVPMTIIYTTFIYFILDTLNKKFDLREVR